VLRSAVALLVFTFVSATGIQAQTADDTPEGESSVIVVTGSATETVPPDGVTIRLLVSNLKDSPKEAADATSEQANAVARAIEALTLDDLSISRVGYGIGPSWQYNADREREFRGYASRVTILVETGMLEEAGRIVEAGVSAGANEVQAVNFTSSETDEARRDALRAAVESARLDASAMAEAAGGRLGRLLLLTTQRLDPPPGVQLQALRVETNRGQTTRGTELTPQDLTVTARVESRWEFAPEPAE
jgi:hypothetical protein